MNAVYDIKVKAELPWTSAGVSPALEDFPPGSRKGQTFSLLCRAPTQVEHLAGQKIPNEGARLTYAPSMGPRRSKKEG